MSDHVIRRGRLDELEAGKAKRFDVEALEWPSCSVGMSALRAPAMTSLLWTLATRPWREVDAMRSVRSST